MIAGPLSRIDVSLVYSESQLIICHVCVIKIVLIYFFLNHYEFNLVGVIHPQPRCSFLRNKLTRYQIITTIKANSIALHSVISLR